MTRTLNPNNLFLGANDAWIPIDSSHVTVRQPQIASPLTDGEFYLPQSLMKQLNAVECDDDEMPVTFVTPPSSPREVQQLEKQNEETLWKSPNLISAFWKDRLPIAGAVKAASQRFDEDVLDCSSPSDVSVATFFPCTPRNDLSNDEIWTDVPYETAHHELRRLSVTPKHTYDDSMKDVEEKTFEPGPESYVTPADQKVGFQDNDSDCYFLGPQMWGPEDFCETKEDLDDLYELDEHWSYLCSVRRTLFL